MIYYFAVNIQDCLAGFTFYYFFLNQMLILHNLIKSNLTYISVRNHFFLNDFLWNLLDQLVLIDLLVFLDSLLMLLLLYILLCILIANFLIITTFSFFLKDLFSLLLLLILDLHSLLIFLKFFFLSSEAIKQSTYQPTLLLFTF